MKVPETNCIQSTGKNECLWGERHNIIQSTGYKLRGAMTSDNTIIKSNKTVKKKKPPTVVLRTQFAKIYQELEPI